MAERKKDEVPCCWWKLSAKLKPEQLDVALAALAAASLLFVLLTIVGFASSAAKSSKAADIALQLDAANTELAVARAEIASLSKPVEGKPQPLVIEKGADSREIQAKVQELNATLAKMDRERNDLQKKLDAATQARANLEQDAVRRKEELKAAQDEMKSLKRAADEAASLQKKLDALDKSFKDAQAELAMKTGELKKTEADLGRAKKELETVARDAEAAAVRLKADIALRDKRIADLDRKLAEFPKTPLTDVQAEIRHNELVNEAKALQTFDERIEVYFRGMMALAGTRFEARMKKLWDTEQRLKEQAVEKAAADVLKEVQAALKTQPDAHDENIKTLEAALEKTKGTRSERSISRLLDAEHKKAEDAAAKAAAEKASREPSPEQ